MILPQGKLSVFNKQFPPLKCSSLLNQNSVREGYVGVGSGGGCLIKSSCTSNELSNVILLLHIFEIENELSFNPHLFIRFPLFLDQNW